MEHGMIVIMLVCVGRLGQRKYYTTLAGKCLLSFHFISFYLKM